MSPWQRRSREVSNLLVHAEGPADTGRHEELAALIATSFSELPECDSKKRPTGLVGVIFPELMEITGMPAATAARMDRAKSRSIVEGWTPRGRQAARPRPHGMSWLMATMSNVTTA